MTRDDSTGGWVPVGGGGLSYVALRKISVFSIPSGDTLPNGTTAEPKVEFLITGHRISDNVLCLTCVIKRTVQYNQVTPTFRHWNVQNKKFGLIFPGPADAKSFDVAVERCIADLKNMCMQASPKTRRTFATLESSDTESISVESDGPLSTQALKPGYSLLHRTAADRRSASPQLSSLSVPFPLRRNLFSQSTQVIPPAKRLLSLPNSMTKSLSSPLQNSTIPRRNPVPVRLSRSLLPASVSASTVTKDSSVPSMSLSSPPEKYTYVDVIANKPVEKSSTTLNSDPPSGHHDYHYPGVRPEKRDSISSIKIHNLDMMSSHRPPLLPIKNKRKRSKKPTNKYSRCVRRRCKYCHEFYSVEGNERGACEFAPDEVKSCINKITCVPAVAKILCKCVEDPEESRNPCSCDKKWHCIGRWFIMVALSILMPCLCCYYPLIGCHKVGLACGLCGGRHEAMEPR